MDYNLRNGGGPNILNIIEEKLPIGEKKTLEISFTSSPFSEVYLKSGWYSDYDASSTVNAFPKSDELLIGGNRPPRYANGFYGCIHSIIVKVNFYQNVCKLHSYRFLLSVIPVILSKNVPKCCVPCDVSCKLIRFLTSKFGKFETDASCFQTFVFPFTLATFPFK